LDSNPKPISLKKICDLFYLMFLICIKLYSVKIIVRNKTLGTSIRIELTPLKALF